MILALVIQDIEQRLNDKQFHGGSEPKSQDQVRIWQLFDVVIGEHTSSLNSHYLPTRISTICVKRNAHLILNFFVALLGEGGQKFTWLIIEIHNRS